MKTLEELRRCRDVSELKSMLRDMSAEFGVVKRLDILTSIHEGRQQAICFLRLEKSEQEQALMRALGVGRFGGEIVFVIDLEAPLSTEEVGPSSQWADYGVL